MCLLCGSKCTCTLYTDLYTIGCVSGVQGLSRDSGSCIHHLLCTLAATCKCTFCDDDETNVRFLLSMPWQFRDMLKRRIKLLTLLSKPWLTSTYCRHYELLRNMSGWPHKRSPTTGLWLRQQRKCATCIFGVYMLWCNTQTGGIYLEFHTHMYIHQGFLKVTKSCSHFPKILPTTAHIKSQLYRK